MLDVFDMSLLNLEIGRHWSYPFCIALCENVSMRIDSYFCAGNDSITWKAFDIEGWPYPVEAPSTWSENAVEIAAKRYFRGETSVRQLVERVVGAISQAGLWQGQLANREEATRFADELRALLLGQYASFNSPVYFNVGVFPSHGLAGHGEAYAFDFETRKVTKQVCAFIRPQASACFIQDLQDDLLSIFDLLKNEAKLFKFGSGSGTNFSRLRARGEALEAGGESSGLIRYLEVFDRAAQAIKSGGTTRRAAKMVVLDADHPEAREFIQWKCHEERKARVLIANGYSSGMDGEAFHTVSGQNSNNSLRVTDDFMRKVKEGASWKLISRRAKQPTAELPARELFRDVARAAWECADPGLQFHDTINKWHMCPESGPIRASNPCSEFMFLDDSACNLASLNLVKFLKNGALDLVAFRHAVRVLLLAQEILVDYAAYPTAKIAENSHRFRPVGLGYANLGGYLMRIGTPYDSEEAAQVTAEITAALLAMALEASAEMAADWGAFAGWQENRESALHVLKQHQVAWERVRSDAHPDPVIDASLSHALKLARDTGLRHAQVTLLAPTGTIGLFMDCDTLGIEPDFALIKRKILAGGGEMIQVNQSIAPALTHLGYDSKTIERICAHLTRTGSLVGAPDLLSQHLAIFDCALAPTSHPERRVTPIGHLRIMAAAQPFLSGAISKTVNLPSSTTVEQVEELYFHAWELGLKSIAIYRDGSKSIQPLCAEC